MRASRLIAAALSCAALLTPLGAVASEGDKVRGMLEGMGYEGIRLDGCLLSFARRVDPAGKDNGFFAYVRRLNLETVEDFAGDITTRETMDGSTVYQMTLNPTDAYRFQHAELVLFGVWARKQFPDIKWPHAYPGDQGDRTPVIEFELRQRMPELDKMNGWLFYTKYGGSTLVERNFQMTFVDIEKVAPFFDALAAYSRQMDCTR